MTFAWPKPATRMRRTAPHAHAQRARGTPETIELSLLQDVTKRRNHGRLASHDGRPHWHQLCESPHYCMLLYYYTVRRARDVQFRNNTPEHHVAPCTVTCWYPSPSPQYNSSTGDLTVPAKLKLSIIIPIAITPVKHSQPTLMTGKWGRLLQMHQRDVRATHRTGILSNSSSIHVLR